MRYNERRSSQGAKPQWSGFTSYGSSGPAPTFSHLDGGTIPRQLVFLLFGIALVMELFAFGASGYATSGMQPSWWMLLCLIPAFGGIFVCRSDSAAISLIGGMLCAGGLGAFSGPSIGHYTGASIMNIAFYTGAITVCMTVAASIFKNFFAGIGGALFGALTLLIFSQIGGIFFALLGFNVAPVFTFMDCIAVVLFSCYIAYDMRVLQDGPSTADHAVDCSVGVFLDIINIFMALLRLFGDSDD